MLNGGSDRRGLRRGSDRRAGRTAGARRPPASVAKEQLMYLRTVAPSLLVSSSRSQALAVKARGLTRRFPVLFKSGLRRHSRARKRSQCRTTSVQVPFADSVFSTRPQSGLIYREESIFVGRSPPPRLFTRAVRGLCTPIWTDPGHWPDDRERGSRQPAWTYQSGACRRRPSNQEILAEIDIIVRAGEARTNNIKTRRLSVSRDGDLNRL